METVSRLFFLPCSCFEGIEKTNLGIQILNLVWNLIGVSSSNMIRLKKCLFSLFHRMQCLKYLIKIVKGSKGIKGGHDETSKKEDIIFVFN